MLKFGNKEFRNLQEQVEKNMKDILFILEEEGVLNSFGIKVVGQEESTEDLPTVEDYKENNPEWGYGDTYAIGTEAPYTLYVLTRANGTHANDYWFNIGQFPVRGPQGEQGIQGETGPQGPQGNTGDPGADAGFGTISAVANTLSPGSSATATVNTSGPNTGKNMTFVFGIPKGREGASTWGQLTGNLSDQVDLKAALDAKQNELVSGNNIKTINNTSLLGSGNININSAVWGNISGQIGTQTDLMNIFDTKQAVINSSNKLSVSFISGLANVALSGDYDDLSDTPDLSIYAQSADLATVATSGSYTDLSDKPTIGNATLTIQKNGVAVDTFTANATVDKSINVTVPTNNNELTNGAGYLVNNDLPVVTFSSTTVQSGSELQSITVDGVAWNIPLSNYVPISRTINSKPLSANVTLTASDVGAVASVTPTTETWTFTLSDNTTTTKTIVTGITVA